MNKKNTLSNFITLVWRTIRYNLKIIFANWFIYFLLAAAGIFLLVTVISVVNSNSFPVEDVYYLLLFPGLLLVFYPTTFGIQNDVDSRMLEILFGIPNYRYKVWLVRMGIIYIVVFGLMFILSLLSEVALTTFPIFDMVFQLMFPIFFIGCLAFMFSTLIRNGYGTAIIMIVIGLVFWISSGILGESKYNIFLNPFDMPSDLSEVIWADMVFKNRLYLIAGTLLSLLAGLLNLQKREKFV
jgi:hypothetical protein